MSDINWLPAHDNDDNNLYCLEIDEHRVILAELNDDNTYIAGVYMAAGSCECTLTDEELTALIKTHNTSTCRECGHT